MVSVHLASGLSGTCESAAEAARILADARHRGRVEVVDSQTGAGGLGCVVIAAARAAERGAELKAVVDAARHARERLQMWFCLDTLEYLRRGGRIGAARTMLGTALKVKPILTFGNEITPVGRVRTRRRALERMDAYLYELNDRGATDWIVQHAQSVEDADHLVARAPRSLVPGRCSARGGTGARYPPRLRTTRRGHRARLIRQCRPAGRAKSCHELASRRWEGGCWRPRCARRSRRRERGGQWLRAEAKSHTGDSAGLDVDTEFGQLLRRIGNADDPSVRYAIVVPPASLSKVVRVSPRIHNLLRIDVYSVDANTGAVQLVPTHSD